MRNNNRVVGFFRGASLGSPIFIEGTTEVSLDEWHHIALVYSYANQEFRIYLDGVLEASGSNSRGWVNSDSFRIGQYYNPSYTTYGLYGYADEIRVTKGVARYTENFNPPTEPFPAK